MYSKEEFAVLELMCREVAELAKREMEFSLSEYWLASGGMATIKGRCSIHEDCAPLE
jgi:hypothetical protein